MELKEFTELLKDEIENNNGDALGFLSEYVEPTYKVWMFTHFLEDRGLVEAFYNDAMSDYVTMGDIEDNDTDEMTEHAREYGLIRDSEKIEEVK